MRMMLKCYPEIQAGNAAVIDGSLPKIIGKLMETLKPEAAYFFPDKGKRSFIMVFEMDSSSTLPTILEPLFEGLQAEVEIFPVMNAEELKTGLSKLQST